MKAIKTLVIATVALGCSFLGTAPGATDFLLELDGVKGESKDQAHPGAIEIDSFSWGVSNPTGATAPGTHGGGKVNISSFNIRTHFNAASPALFLACATGQHIKKATLTVRKSSPPTAAPERFNGEYLIITLTDVLVSGINEDGVTNDAEGLLTESLSLNFAKIEFKYTLADGSVRTATYDLKAAKK